MEEEEMKPKRNTKREKKKREAIQRESPGPIELKRACLVPFLCLQAWAVRREKMEAEEKRGRSLGKVCPGRVDN